MRNLFSLPLGAQCAPFGFSQRCVEISDTFPFVGGLLGYLGASQTNDTNYDIATMTNSTNSEINDKQLAWARENYELEKEENRFLVDQAYNRSLADRENERAYQSYKNQIKLMREAGINPSLMLSGSSGHAGASVSTVNTVGSPARHNQPGMIPMQTGAPMQNTLDSFGMGLSKTADLMLARDIHESDLSMARAKLGIESMKAMAEVKKAGADTKYTNQLTDQIAKQMLFDDQSWSDRLDSIRKSNNLMENQANLAKQQAIAQEFTNNVAPELHELQKRSLQMSICIAAAQVANINANTSLTAQQKSTEIERTKQEAFVRANLPKSLHNDNAIKTATYRQISKQAQLIEQQYKTEAWRTVDASKTRFNFNKERSLMDYMQYANDVYENIEINNKRSYFRPR